MQSISRIGRFLVLALMAAVLPSAPGRADAARLKELVDVEGFRSNPLVGLGIVVGLKGTGDDTSSFLARRPLATLMKHLGTNIDDADVRSRNVAMVMVTATLPPFAKPGVPFDVVVSSAGTARSLQGGTLIATGLRGVDRQTYAIAQGQLTTGGYDVSSSFSGSLSQKNHVTVARIPGGATVEREVALALPTKEIVLLLHEPDFTTASRISAAIVAKMGDGAAKVRDPGAVTVAIADDKSEGVVQLIASLEAIEATPDAPARVVIDERTGTVVVGANVTLGPAAIAYGGLYINVLERFGVSQPNGYFNTGARSVIVPDSAIDVREQEGKMQVLQESATVGDVAAAMNTLGVRPRDLVPIFQALKAAGALRAAIEVM